MIQLNSMDSSEEGTNTMEENEESDSSTESNSESGSDESDNDIKKKKKITPDSPNILIFFYLVQIRSLMYCYVFIPNEIIQTIMQLFLRLVGVHPNNILPINQKYGPTDYYFDKISKDENKNKIIKDYSEDPNAASIYMCDDLDHEYFQDCKKVWIERIGKNNLYLDKGYRHCPVKWENDFSCHYIIDTTEDKKCVICKRYCCYICFDYGHVDTCTQCRGRHVNLIFRDVPGINYN